MYRNNPEALHDVGQDKTQKVGEGFVNPGTPEAPLVREDQMTRSTIKGASEDLKKSLIK